jgi:carboxyl-terminal processing protease
MNRSRTVFFVLSAILVLSLISGSLLGAVADGDGSGDDSLYKHLSMFTEVLSLIRQAYVDAPDLETLMAGALDGTTEALDPFSLYVPEAEVEAFRRAREIGTRLSGLTLLKERGVAYVVAVAPGSPATEAGIEAGDLVTEIAGRNTRVMPLWEVKEELAREPGTAVELHLLRLGESLSVSLELGSFTPPEPTLQQVEGVPVLRIPAFLPESPTRVRELVEQVRTGGGDRLVVDLRGIAGGDPEMVFPIAELFAGGELGALTAKGKRLAEFRSEAEPLWTGSLVVLVTRGTLGPAELLAEVLRQGAGAELVGEQSFGWAGREEWADLPSGGRLFFTGAFYTGPDGEPLNEGLEPDLRVDRASFNERELPLDQLILDRGIQRVRELAGEPAAETLEAAAA